MVSLPPKRMSRYMATSSSSVITSSSRESSISFASSGPSPVRRTFSHGLADVVAERVDRLVGLAQRLLVEGEQPPDRLRPLPDQLAVGLRDADEVDDHPHRQLVGQVQLDVGLRLALHLLDEVVDVPLHRLPQQLDPPGAERAGRDPAQPLVLVAVLAGEEVALEVQDLEEHLVLLHRQPADGPLGQLAEPVGVLPDRVLPGHHVLDVGVAGDQRRRAAVPAHHAGALHASGRTSGTARRSSRDPR